MISRTSEGKLKPLLLSAFNLFRVLSIPKTLVEFKEGASFFDVVYFYTPFFYILLRLKYTMMDKKYSSVLNDKTGDSQLAKKHVPIVETEDSGNGSGFIVEIKVGNVEHPSEENHYINWIGIYNGDVLLEKVQLTPESKPRVTFYLREVPENLKVREFCNIHGTWEYSQ